MTGRDGTLMAWRDGDVLMVVLTALVCVVAIAVGWFGASGSATLTHQVAYLNLAVAGFAVFAGGNCLWLLRGRRAVGARRAALIALERAEPVRQAPAALTAATTASWQLVRGAGMRRLHQPDCPLVAGKPVDQVGLADGEPCGVCAA